MNRIGELANKQFELGAIERGLRILEDCLVLNRQAGHLPDVAACLINIGNVAKATGDTARARSCFAEAVTILEREQHPMLTLAKNLRQECE